MQILNIEDMIAVNCSLYQKEIILLHNEFANRWESNFLAMTRKAQSSLQAYQELFVSQGISRFFFQILYLFIS